MGMTTFTVHIARLTYSNSDESIQTREALEAMGFKFKKHHLDRDMFGDPIDHKYWTLRDEEQTVTIELDDLQSLIAFTSQFGQIILHGQMIMIYNDYIE